MIVIPEKEKTNVISPLIVPSCLERGSRLQHKKRKPGRVWQSPWCKELVLCESWKQDHWSTQGRTAEGEELQRLLLTCSSVLISIVCDWAWGSPWAWGGPWAWGRPPRRSRGNNLQSSHRARRVVSQFVVKLYYFRNNFESLFAFKLELYLR